MKPLFVDYLLKLDSSPFIKKAAPFLREDPEAFDQEDAIFFYKNIINLPELSKKVSLHESVSYPLGLKIEGVDWSFPNPASLHQMNPAFRKQIHEIFFSPNSASLAYRNLKWTIQEYVRNKIKRNYKVSSVIKLDSESLKISDFSFQTKKSLFFEFEGLVGQTGPVKGRQILSLFVDINPVKVSENNTLYSVTFVYFFINESNDLDFWSFDFNSSKKLFMTLEGEGKSGIENILSPSIPEEYKFFIKLLAKACKSSYNPQIVEDGATEFHLLK